MMLILITIVAAASLAVIVSEATKQEADRRAHQAAVENEELLITGIDLFIIDHQIRAINVTVQNLNIQDSRLLAFYVNDTPCHNYSVKSVNGIDKMGEDNWIWKYNYNLTNRYDVPASSTVVVTINLTQDKSEIGGVPAYPWDFLNDLHVLENCTVKIKIMTSYINTFSKTYNIPNSIPVVTIQTQSLGSFKRDYLWLDGSGSKSENSILDYSWEINDSANNPVYDANGNLIYPKGKVTQAYLPSKGPFKVSLTVKDSYGLAHTSKAIEVPPDDSFNPAAHIKWSPVSADEIGIQVTDVNDKPIDAYISLIPDAGISLNTLYGSTGGLPSSYFIFKVLSGTGNIRAVNGTLSVTIPYSGPVPLPVADFEANVTSGTAPLCVGFTDKSTNGVSWLWDFGDGTTSTQRHPVHEFGLVGSPFTVKLTVTNVAGSDIEEKVGYITVS
jgi:PKD repeat protein